jgi:predicted transcriptional regulator
MSVYIKIPSDYERRIQKLAERSMRTYHQQTAWLLCWAIDQVDSVSGAREGWESLRHAALAEEMESAQTES